MTSSSPPEPAAESAVLLLSGGLDSSTLLALACAEPRRVFALSFRYGQRHEVELQYARRQAKRPQVVEHRIVDLDHLGVLVAPASALVRGSDLAVPKDRDVDVEDSVPSTYVPARNTLFLTYGLAWAEVIGAPEIWIGANALDYSGYPDCRPAFFSAYESMANLATRAVETGGAYRIRTPLLHLKKHEIIRKGHELGVDFGDTLSCYDPAIDGSRGLACRRCDSCQLRRRGFERAGAVDPTVYVDPD